MKYIEILLIRKNGVYFPVTLLVLRATFNEVIAIFFEYANGK